MVSLVMNPAKSADTSAYVLKHLVMLSLRVERTRDQYSALLWQVVATLCLRCLKSVVSIYAPYSKAPAARYG